MADAHVLPNRRQFDNERLLRVMVFNRLCDPESKLGMPRWLEGARVPEVATASVTHQRLLRTMDTLADCAEIVGGAGADDREGPGALQGAGRHQRSSSAS